MSARLVTTITLLLAIVLLTAGPFMVVAPSDLTPKEELGKALFFDKISSPDWMSCANCHDPDVGFTGPNAGINKHGSVYRGAVPKRFGNRKPPSAAYATLSPLFHFDDVDSVFVGGNFWDGRATGDNLGNPAADQALGPFLNPVEQNNPSKKAVLEQVANAKYAWLWEVAWGEPLRYDTPTEIETNYGRVGLSIAEYEASSEVNQFSSKFDYVVQGMAEFTPEEAWGLDLFTNKAGCAACHPAPLFTDFTYDNVGVPRNPDNPFYDMDEVYLDDGTPINPLGEAWIDPGLGGFLAYQSIPAWQAMAAENMGKHKVPTLRNVDKRKGDNSPKSYFHNGSFKSLEDVVHFYNTRDTENWPEPEVAENVNEDELGDLGLTPAEEEAIVAFMATLSDGFVPAASKGSAGPVERGDERVALTVLGPNPFNPITRIGFSIGHDGPVTLDVFDVNGRKVVALVRGWRSAGSHEVSFDAGTLPSGTYLVQLVAGTEVMTAKVTLLK